MPVDAKEPLAESELPSRSPSRFLGLLASPFLWGTAATVTFYLVIPWLPVHRELLQRYFCGHPLEYALAALFFLGIAILLKKAIGVTSEKTAFLAGFGLLTEFRSESKDEKNATILATQLGGGIAKLPPRLRSSACLTRIRDASAHVRGQGSGRGLGEHLKYLAELSAARLYESYALVRTITWAVPILGFLGTVIGITLAISNLTPEQLDTSLNAVTNGLGVAFDTTALSLALSVVLVFTSFLVERAEQQILARVEDFGINIVIPALSSRVEELTPFAQAEAQAAKQLLAETDALIGRQTQLWQEVLESTRSQWVDALIGQKQDFDTALQNGMQNTLTDHAEQLGRVREEFLTAFQSASQELRDGMAVSHNAQQEMQTSFRQRMDDLWQSVQEDVSDRQNEQRIQMDRLTQTVTEKITTWQTQLHESTEAGVEQLSELRRQREVLLKVASQEEELTRLQDRLNQNLDSLRATETFEETMHNLSAAVHLLSAKTTRSRAA